jgi:protein-tyrosine phosphatase
MSVEGAAAPEQPVRILTVCLGNICRSPTAEAALVMAADELGVPLEVASAGTGDWHVGAPPDTRMQSAASAAGLELRGTAQQVDVELLSWADLVVVMDRTNLSDVQGLAARTGVTTPVVLFRSTDPLIEAEDHFGAEVPDPYYGGPQGFTDVVEMCRRTAHAMVSDLDAVLARARAGTRPHPGP